MRQAIKNEVLNKIKDDEALIFEIAQFLGKKFRTVYQWVLDNHTNLTTPAVLELIKSKYGLDESEVLDEINGIAA